jgi:hypothetical protein
VVVVMFGDNELIADFGETNPKGFQQIFWCHHHVGWTIGNHTTSKKQDSVARRRFSNIMRRSHNRCSAIPFKTQGVNIRRTTWNI